MASNGKGGGFNTYKEVQTYQDDWGKPITTVSDYPDHVCRPVIVDVQESRSPTVSNSTKHYVRASGVCRSYDSPLNGLLDNSNRYNEWYDHSPRKANDFFDKFHNEPSRSTHPTFLSPPKWITNKPSWRSPPRSRSTPEDWDSRRGHDDYVKSPFSNNKDDYGKPKFNGGYKTTSPPLGQATNDIGTAMKILGEGNKPLASPTYARRSDFPASYSTPHMKESYPERTQGGKPLASPVSTQPSYYPTSIPITERKESYPEPTKGMKSLFSPAQKNYSGTIDSKEVVKKYNGAFIL